MPLMYLAFLVALGASLCPYAESGKIGLAEFTAASEAGSCASGEALAWLQHHARQQEASQLYERNAVAGAAHPSSSRKDGKLAQDEGLVRVQDSKQFHGGHDGQVESHCDQIGPDEGLHQCSCYHFDNQTVPRNHNPAVYRNYTMWRPAPSATVFSEVQQQHLLRDAALRGMIPGIAYNPSLLPLPQGLAASWHPDAHYLVVTRHYLGEHECEVKTEGAEFAWTGSNYSSIALLDKNLQTLIVGKLPVPIEDYRLFAFQGKVLVTANAVDRDVKDPEKLWSYRVFELGLNFTRGPHNALQQCPRLLKVELNEFTHNGVSDFDHESSLYRFYGKNIGLINNNKDGELKLLWRLSNPVAVMPWTSGTLYTKLDSSALRNNGNPVYLPEYDAYLAFGHTFWEGQVDLHGENHTHIVRNYIHRFVLFDAKPPYNWIRASEPLCLPAISGMSKTLHPFAKEEWCEGIQFIMSWFREGDDIVFTYGVTDCEPAVARVPLLVLLGATSDSFSTHPGEPHDKMVDVLEGEWKFESMQAKTAQ